MFMYVVDVSVTNAEGKTRHLPMFYLHPNVHGIVSTEHAEKIVRDIVDPFGVLTVHTVAIQVQIPY